MYNKNRAIVLGCHVGGLGVIRALGMNNVQSIALTYDNFDFAFTSKYVIEKIEVPHPRREENAFIGFLMENGEKWKGSLILETDDHSAESISKNRFELQKYYNIVTPQWEILKQFVEKKEAHKLALESGVPHPANYLPHTLEQLEVIKDKLSYPTLIKPVHGHVFKSIFNEKNFEVNSEEELFKKFIVRERESSTVIRKGLAIPHISVKGKNIVKALLVRAKAGIIFPGDEITHIIFVIVGSADERILHLKILAAIAQIVQNPGFDKKWLEASSKEELKHIILLAERRRDSHA